MVTYFNRKDLVSFGSYLLSEKRKALLETAREQKIEDGSINPPSVEEQMKEVHHADIENWIKEK